VRKPAPAQTLPDHVLSELVAELRHIANRAEAAQSALRGGRLDAAQVWVSELLLAARRLERAAERALPRTTI